MLNEELYDMDRMEDEVDAEQYVGEMVVSAGHAAFLPLANSMGMESSNMFAGQEFIDMDLILMRNQKPDTSVIILRYGWGTSVGANAERHEALRLGWTVLDMEDYLDGGAFREELERIRIVRGPCFCYVAGKYRHLKPEVSAGNIELEAEDIPEDNLELSCG